PPAWLSDSLKHKTRRLQEAAALRAEQLAELVLDERVERARQAAVGAGVVLEEEQVRPPELDAIGERCAALLDEAAKLSEVPGAGRRNGWRLGSRLRLGLGLGRRLGLECGRRRWPGGRRRGVRHERRGQRRGCESRG